MWRELMEWVRKHREDDRDTKEQKDRLDEALKALDTAINDVLNAAKQRKSGS